MVCTIHERDLQDMTSCVWEILGPSFRRFMFIGCIEKENIKFFRVKKWFKERVSLEF
jgi:hypothetical protein